MNELKHTMRTGSLVRLTRHLLQYSFDVLDDNGDWIIDTITVQPLDIGMVVDDLIEEEEEHDLLVLFQEKIVRADCRVLRRVK